MKTFLLLCAGCWAGILSAQQPQFIMPIWFEDAVGNKDTIWVGGDPSASSQNLNPQFGEIAITAPFDSVFEVRVVHGDDVDWETSKIIVDFNDAPGHCYLAARSRIMIQAKYLPVKISWDTTILATNYPCNINTILTPDLLTSLLQYWYEARIIYCMMTKTQIIDDFDYSEFPSIIGVGPTESLLVHEFEVEGQGLKQLHGLFFTGFWDYPYCYDILPTNEIDNSTNDGFTVSPNPASDKIQVYSQSPEKITTISISDVSGRILKTINADAYPPQVDITDLKSGFYYLNIRLKNGAFAHKKFIKP